MIKRFFEYLTAAVARNKGIGVSVVALFATILICAAHLLAPDLVEEFENRTWDLRLRLVADPARADKNIKLVIIDQGTLDFFEKEYGITWPFPRDIYSYVIDYLKDAGVKGLAFDLLFTESSAQAVETDVALAKASAGALPIVHAVTMETSEKVLRRDKFELFARRQREADEARKFSSRYLKGGAAQEFISATLPIPELLEMAQGFGTVSAAPDSDGIFRHYGVGGRLEGVPVLSLPFEFYDLVTRGQEPPVSPETLVDRHARIAVRLHGPSGTYQSYPLHAIAQSRQLIIEGQKPVIDPAQFKDAWVLLGVWAPGLLDLRPTPLEEKGKGVEFVAAVLDNHLHGDFVRKMPEYAAPLIALAVILLVSVAVFVVANPLLQAVCIGLLLAAFGGGAIYLAANAVWVPVFLPSGGMLLAIISSLGMRFQIEGRQHRFVKGAFQYYVSKGVIDQIIIDPSRLALGGERRDLTIFFSDIKGFTTISESLDPTQLVQLLNDYLTQLTDIILLSGGTLDKYVGDAIVAFWNAPIPVADHAVRGVQAAIDCQRVLEKNRDKFREQFGVDVYTRIGIHTGPVSVGNFGSKTRFNYTMIGDGANLASRLEGVNKVFGTPILISAQTKALIGDSIQVRKVADLRVVGKSEVVPVYQPLINETHLFNAEHLSRYQQAMEQFEAGNLERAEQLFSSLENDPVALSYLKRIRNERSTENTGWSPVWNMTDK